MAGVGTSTQPGHGVARFTWHPASANEVCFSPGLIKHHLHVAALLPTLKLALPGVLAGDLLLHPPVPVPSWASPSSTPLPSSHKNTFN